ncbi:ABC transporter substrate-binding protein [Saccharopolyspora sp. NPDC050642]|uniref:ABC transporter substrate-binding protein n=1 Tax=Saccharopolyspora sp. NPDC050642 TaxID=3157099 RepID=UPI0034068A73
MSFSRRRIGRLAAAIAVAALVSTACGSGTGSPGPAGDVFRWGYSTPPTSLDPHRTASAFDLAFLVPIYDTLTLRTASGELEPNVATAWEFSPDRRNLTLTLAGGRTFQDGSPIDAAAVKANVDRAAAPASSVRNHLKGLTGVHVIDARHVALSFNRPAGDIPAVLSNNAGMLVNPAKFGDPGLSTGLPTAGSGVFQVTASTATTVSYERWDGHPQAASVAIAGIEMQVQNADNTRLAAVRSGQLDATFIRPSQVAEAQAAQLKTVEGTRTQFYGLRLNPGKENLGSPAVRRAMMHAIDRRTINEHVYDGLCEPTPQPWPSRFFAYDHGLDEEAVGGYDPALARRLLAEAGLPGGFHVTLTVTNISAYTRLAEVIQGQLAEIGVEVELKIMDSVQASTAVRKGSFEMYVGPNESARPGPTSFLSEYFLPGGTSNPGDFDLPGIDAQVDQVRRTASEEQQAPAIRAAVSEVLAAGPPVVPVCVPATVLAHRDGVRGLEVPLYGNYDFRRVSKANH